MSVRNHIIPLVIFTILASCKEAGIAVYVSPKGVNNNIGSKTSPVANLKTALQRVREIREKQTVNDTVFIWLEEGDYQFTETVVINELDSIGIPLVISAVPNAKVSINGAIQVDAEVVQTLSDDEKQLFPEKARENIRKIDLKEQGITKYGELSPIGFFRPTEALEMELFVNGKSGRLARWPNDSIVTDWEAIREGGKPRFGDTTKLGGIIHYPTERIHECAKAKDAWLHGTFGTGYADDNIPVKEVNAEQQTIELASPHLYGVNSRVPWHWWYIYNLPQELDTEGEYYIERENGIVYFYPPQEGVETIQLSLLEEPLLAIENTSNVHIRNITLEATRGMAIYIEGGHLNTIDNCVIRNTGSVGISIGKGITAIPEHIAYGSGKPISRTVGSLQKHIYDNTTFDRESGHHHCIINCEIYDTGQGGISLGGGDKVTLEKGNNLVHNNHIYRYNRRAQGLKVAVDLYGTGNTVSNNEINDGFNMGIYMHGNDHVIEYNEFYNILNDVQDFGVVYYGRNPSDQGNIIRYNYFHDNGGQWGYTKAIYLDDGTNGAYVYGNIITDMRPVSAKHDFENSASKGILINGGSHNKVLNNLFIDNPVGVDISSILISRPYHAEKGGVYEIRLNKVNFQSPPYSISYPLLVNFFDNPNVPKENLIEDNVFLNVNKVSNTEEVWERTLKTRPKDEQIYYEPLKPDWSFIPKRNLISIDKYPYLLNKGDKEIPTLNYKEIRKVLPDFKEIPIGKIGHKKMVLSQ